MNVSNRCLPTRGSQDDRHGSNPLSLLHTSGINWAEDGPGARRGRHMHARFLVGVPQVTLVAGSPLPIDRAE